MTGPREGIGDEWGVGIGIEVGGIGFTRADFGTLRIKRLRRNVYSYTVLIGTYVECRVG